MGRKQPCQGSSMFPALVLALGLLDLSALGSQQGGDVGSPCKSRIVPLVAHRSPNTKQRPGTPASPEGTSQRDMPLGDRPWRSTDHGWLQDAWSEQGGHIRAEMSPLCMSLMQRGCFMSHALIKPIPEAPVQVWAQVQHPRERMSPTQRRKDIPPIIQEAGRDPGPSSPRPFACGTSRQPRLCSLAGCWDENKVQILLLAEITSSPTVI